MPVKFEVSSTPHIVVFTVIAHWSIEEIHSGYNDAQGFLDKADRTIHVLVDATQIGNLPPNIMRVRKSPFVEHKRIGELAIVGGNAFLQSVAKTMMKLVNFKRVHFFDTVEEGLNYLRSLS